MAKVRTPAGERKFWPLKIGMVITPQAITAAETRHGKQATHLALLREELAEHGGADLEALRAKAEGRNLPTDDDLGHDVLHTMGQLSALAASEAKRAASVREGSADPTTQELWVIRRQAEAGSPAAIKWLKDHGLPVPKARKAGSSLSKQAIRRVKTPEGERFFGLRRGQIITPNRIQQLQRKHGHLKVTQALHAHTNVPTIGTKTPSLDQYDAQKTRAIQQFEQRIEAATTPDDIQTVLDMLDDAYELDESILKDLRKKAKDHLQRAHERRNMAAYGKVVKRKTEVDGDGDGWVLEGTPKKRPATPAEMEAGRLLRAQRNRPHASDAAGGGGKLAPAKTKYDQTIDKFVAAIDAAKSAGDFKRVDALIQRDEQRNHDLSALDLKDLKGLLQARRDGVPAPKPVGRSNRAKRGAVAEAHAPGRDDKIDAVVEPKMKAEGPREMGKPNYALDARNPKNKEVGRGQAAGAVQAEMARRAAEDKKKYDAGAAEQKAINARKKPPAKKAPAKKASFDLPGSMDRAGKYADRIKNAKDRKELDAIGREFHADPRLREVHRRALRQDWDKASEALLRAVAAKAPAKRSTPSSQQMISRPKGRRTAMQELRNPHAKKAAAQREAKRLGPADAAALGLDAPVGAKTSPPRKRLSTFKVSASMKQRAAVEALRRKLGGPKHRKRVTALDSDDWVTIGGDPRNGARLYTRNRHQTGNGPSGRQGPVTPGNTTARERGRRQAMGIAPRSPTLMAWEKELLAQTPHGKKTQAWQKLVARDIKNAKTGKQLQGLRTQVKNLRAANRISQQEHDDLMVEIQAKANALQGGGRPDRNKPVHPSGIARLMAALNMPTPPKSGPFGAVASNNRGGRPGADTKAARIEAAESLMRDVDKIGSSADFDAWQRKMQYDTRVMNLKDDRALQRKVENHIMARRAQWRHPSEATVQPKLPPGAARQKAGAQPAQPKKTAAEAVKAKADRAYDPYEINGAIIELDKAHRDGVVNDKDYNEAFDYLDQKLEALEKKEQGWPGTGTDHDDDVSAEAYEAQHAYWGPDGKKGDLAGAPEAGLWNFIRANPQRFKIEGNNTAAAANAISQNYWVDDKQTGERWMMKAASHNFAVQREDVAGEVMKQAGLPHITTKLASAPANNEGEMSYVLQRHAGEELYGDRKAPISPRQQMALENPWGEGFAGLANRVADGGDPDAPARLMIYDYLIDNKVDRHHMNIMFANPEHKRDGPLDLVIIDQGLAFGGRHLLGDKPKEDLNQPFEKFMNDWRGNDWNGMGLAYRVAGDKGELKRAMRRQIDAFKKMDWDSIEAKYAGKGGNPEVASQVKVWRKEYEYRLNYLDRNLDGMVSWIANRGGGFGF